MPLAAAAISIILNESGSKVLLVKRRDVPVWVLPGGGIDSDETPEQAAKREVFEETGFHIAIIRQTGEYHPINNLASHTSVFLSKITGGKSQASHETAGMDFFDINDLPSSFFSIHRDWLVDALTHAQMVKKPLSQVTYWAAFKHLIRHPSHVLRYLWTRFKKL